MDVVERFRTNTRRVHIWIFLGLSMLLSAVTSLLLVHHIISGSPLLFAAGYGGVMFLATAIAFIIPAVDSEINPHKFIKLVKNQQPKYMLFTLIYFWIGIGFYILYPMIHFSSSFDIFPSVYTGLVAGTLCICLGLQFILLNYILVGPTQLSKEDLERLKEMIDEDLEEFDPEKYKDRDIEDLEAYKDRIEEEQEKLEDNS